MEPEKLGKVRPPREMWYMVSSSSPHAGHSGSVQIFITLSRLLNVMCLVSRPTEIPGCFLSKHKTKRDRCLFVVTSWLVYSHHWAHRVCGVHCRLMIILLWVPSLWLFPADHIIAGWFVIAGGALLKPGTTSHMFVISHFQGTNPVQYNVNGWLKACRENPISRSATTLLQESKRCVEVVFIRRASAPFGRSALYLLTEGWPGWVDLSSWLYTEIDFLHWVEPLTWSPIPVLTWPGIEQLCWLRPVCYH